MKEFEFYMEFDGKRSHRLEENQAEPILAADIDKAIKKFSRRKGLALESVDQLEDDQYRVFFEKRAFLKPSRQYIYFVTSK